MNRFKTCFFLILFLLSGTVVFSQQLRMELGDKYFDQYAYKKAIRLYEGAEKKGYSNWTVYAKLGDCYYFTAKPKRAIENYKTAIELNNDINPIYRLRYALSLHSVGEEQEALVQFKKYHRNIGEIDLRSIKASPVLAENLSLNSEYSDFGSFIRNDTLYFASSRENPVNPRRFNKRLYKWNEQPFLDIYAGKIIKQSDSISFELIPSDSLKLDINTVAHESSVAITKDGKTMYYTGGKSKNGKLVYDKHGVSNHKIYRATNINNQWIMTKSDSLSLKFLDFPKYSFSNPALSPDDKRLFFVSCAPFPKAKGHTDIYYVDLYEDGSYGEITNIEGINTSGRESFPFISDDGHLYFSSNGIHDNKISLGLLDIYKVEDINKVIQDQKVDSIVHLPRPFNSEKDDFAFFIEPSKESKDNKVYAYFSSNRDHPYAKGDDDIYRARINLRKTVGVVVIDSITHDRLNKAFVDIIDDEGKVLQSTKVDSTGAISFKAELGKDYRLRGYLTRYYDDLKMYNSSKDDSLITLRLLPYPCEISINHIEFDLDSDRIRQDEEASFEPVLDLLLSNPDIKIRIESHTDSHGEPSYNLDLSRRRAEATKVYLLEKGVKEYQITFIKGYGENCLLYSDELINSTPINKREKMHELNRRSIFIIEGCDNVNSCEDNRNN